MLLVLSEANKEEYHFEAIHMHTRSLKLDYANERITWLLIHH